MRWTTRCWLAAALIVAPGCGGTDDSGDGSQVVGGVGGSFSPGAGGSGGGSGGSGAGGAMGNPNDPLNDARQACVDRINGFRAMLDLPPYARWVEPESCTDGQAESDSRTGATHGEFGACGERAQNECPEWDSIEETIDRCLASMWSEGPPPAGVDCSGGTQCFKMHGHFLTMSSTRYSRVACGFHVRDDGAVWAIQNFR